jgi:hypothetical protein
VLDRTKRSKIAARHDAARGVYQKEWVATTREPSMTN